MGTDLHQVVLIREHPLTRNTIWMTGSIRIMLMPRSFRRKGSITDIALPVISSKSMGWAVVDVLVVGVVAIEPSLAGVTVGGHVDAV